MYSFVQIIKRNLVAPAMNGSAAVVLQRKYVHIKGTNKAVTTP